MLTTLPSLRRVPQQRAASLGTTHAAIVGVTSGASLTEPFRVLFWNNVGRTAIWSLAGVSSNGNDGCCALVPTTPGGTTPGFLVVATKNGSQQVVVQEFTLPADPFLSAPTFAQAPPVFGDADSRQTEFVLLPSGELIVVNQQQSLSAVDCLVRATDGTWGSAQRLSVSTAVGTSYQMSACVAPWDGSLFVANMYDGALGIDVATFALVGGALAPRWNVAGIINRLTVNGAYVMGVLANNGEDPSLVAVPFGNVVALSYTNVEFPVAPDPAAGTRQAHPVVASITPNASPAALAIGSDWVLSILNPCPLAVQGSALTLEYATGYPSPITLHSIGNTTSIANLNFAWSATTRDFVVIQPGGAIALVQFDAAAGAPPIATPPGTLIAATLISFSWSGDDPGNSNRYMLQRSSTPNGPWTNVGTRWPIGVSGKVASPTSGSVVAIDGTSYYRLLPL